MTRHDSCMNPGRLRLEPKREYALADVGDARVLPKDAVMNWQPATVKPRNFDTVLILFKSRPNLENIIVCGYWDGEQWGPYRARRFPVAYWAPIPKLPDDYYC